MGACVMQPVILSTPVTPKIYCLAVVVPSTFSIRMADCIARLHPGILSFTIRHLLLAHLWRVLEKSK
jgi:hypothetical protein